MRRTAIGSSDSFARDCLDRALHHPARDRHRRAHRAVAAFVGQHDLDIVGVICEPIRPAQDHRNNACEIIRRIEAIGAEVFDNLELKGENAALAVDRGARTHHIFARMACCDQIFIAVFAPAHRSPQLARQRRDRKLFAIKRNFLAEAAADVGRDHGDLGSVSRRRRASWCDRDAAPGCRYACSGGAVRGPRWRSSRASQSGRGSGAAAGTTLRQ
jgi:hypothetical protein